MSYIFYKSLHLGSLFLLFFSLGGLWLFYFREVGNVFKRQLLILHGISWFIVIVAGFGLIVRSGIASPWPLWIYIKLIIGIILGLVPLLFRKTIRGVGRKKTAQGMFLFVVVLVVLALLSVYRKI